MAKFSFEVTLSTKTMFQFKKIKIWILKTTSKEKTTNMKVVGIEELWNFVVHNVFVWNHLVMQNLFEFFQTISDGKTTKIRVVDLEI